MSSIYDNRPCELGEGPLWHPLREELFWFDILGRKLLSKTNEWQFEDYVSAAGWVDKSRILIASSKQLFVFDLETSQASKVADLEADNPVTRSNDGRADPQGGFWVGTMGLNAEAKAGAIYRYYKGELRLLFPDITISNSICFAPNGQTAYFCDTPEKVIMAVVLDQNGWPAAEPTIAVDLRKSGENPDGSVVDAAGNIWNAQWGASRVACYSPKGEFLSAATVGADHTSCPAFAGASSRMFVTTARQGLSKDQLAQNPKQGQTFAVQVSAIGQLEHQVIL